MKKITAIFLTGLLVVSATAVLAEAGKPAPAPAPVLRPGQVRSTFTMPTKFSEGRDPFYPESTRVFQAIMAETSSHTVEISSLAVKGYYRDAKGAFVIINNHTFTVGDEGDVLTAAGRIHLKCVDVLPSAVVIEFNGSLHQLPLNLPK